MSMTEYEDQITAMLDPHITRESKPSGRYQIILAAEKERAQTFAESQYMIF